MDQTRFQDAKKAYEAGDFRAAAKGFLASAGRGADGNGAAYHMAGNALMRLRRHQDAVTVYGHALRDGVYDRRGAVWANLGTAYADLGEYAEAVKAYENAIAEADYSTPYKAHQGMAGALLERGRVEEAAIAYRKAALDPANPDPGKALVNLGLCFMGLRRPADAVEAYRAALGFDEYQGRGKALANMGQALVVLDEYAEAVRAFEKAIELHNHQLSVAARANYETALAHVGRTAVDAEDVIFIPDLDEVPDEVPDRMGDGPADGSSEPPANDPAEVPVALAEAMSEPEAPFVDFGDEFSAANADLTQPLAPFDRADPSAELGIGDETAVADFFSATDEQLKERDRAARKAERSARGPLAMWRGVIVVALVVVLVVAGLAGAYRYGFGWPTQEQAVAGMLDAYEGGSAVGGYWVAVPAKDVAKEMAKIPPMKTYTLDGVERRATTSKALVTVTPKTGAALHYTITLSREGVGWKVDGIENDWSSAGG